MAQVHFFIIGKCHKCLNIVEEWGAWKMNEQTRRANRFSHSARNSILALIGFLTPIVALGAIGEWAYIQIMGSFWYYSIWDMNYDPQVNFMINPLILLSSIPFWLPRLAGVLMSNRLYKGKTTSRRAFTFSIIGECWILGLMILYLITMLLFPSPYQMMSFPIAVPFPFVTVTARVFTKIDPPQEGKMWIEDEVESEESGYWWEEEEKKEEEDTIRVPRREKLW